MLSFEISDVLSGKRPWSMRAAAAAVLACAAAQDVALCVTGQLRTFAHERVRRSQESFVAALRAEASTVDAFLVVSGAPSDADRARLAAVYAPVSLDVAADVAGALDQYGMLATCGARMRRRGGHAWAVKSRFDVFWYGPFPPLATLPPHAIHSRMRCWVFEGAFSADAASRAAIDRRFGDDVSRAATSTSIRPMFGRIDGSRRVLDARQKRSRRNGRLRAR